MDNQETKAPEPENNHTPDSAGPADADLSCPQESAGQEAPQTQQPANDASKRPDQPERKGPAENKRDHTALVRYGHLKMLGEFRRPTENTFSIGTKVVVRTERGIEIGEIVLAYCEGSGDRGVSRQRWQSYLTRCGSEESISHRGQILRTASPQDLIDQRHLDQAADQKLQFCRELIQQMRLDMKPVAVEHLFGGDRILFYFKSEKRVDFRKLVRSLAKEYQTRIEMRQVGSRDEARLLADYGRCGHPCCCRAFLKILAPVNMKMAKVQKATLDPTKISGRCGRLMCCLRYENRTYEELRKKLPSRNTVVETPEGPAVVVDRQILSQLVVVRLPDARRMAFPLEELTVRSKKSAKAFNEDDQQDETENSNSNNKSRRPKKRHRKNHRKPN